MLLGGVGLIVLGLGALWGLVLELVVGWLLMAIGLGRVGRVVGAGTVTVGVIVAEAVG